VHFALQLRRPAKKAIKNNPSYEIFKASKEGNRDGSFVFYVLCSYCILSFFTMGEFWNTWQRLHLIK
jgi:hypothetical protein